MGSLQELYLSEFPKISSYILKNSGTIDDARDIFQETVMTLFSHVKLNKFKEEYEIGGFMFVVARNNWKRKNRHKVEFVNIEDKEPIDFFENDTYDQLFEKEKKDFVNNLFDQLGESCKKILTLTIFEKNSMADLTELLGYSSVDSTKTKHYKCKQRLIKLVESKPKLKYYLKNEFNS